MLPSKILILGGKGYIGSAVFEKISKFYDTTNHDVKHFDDTLFPDYDVIINLAAHSSVSLCEIFPESAKYNNVTRLQQILDNLSDKQFLIHASSASVYGFGNFVSCEMDKLPTPSNLYDETKMHGDALIEANILAGKKVASLRFGTVAGLSTNTRVDLVLNAMVLSAKTLGEVSVINPELRRNILFIDDLVEALKRLIEVQSTGIYNLGSLNVTIGSLASAISTIHPIQLNILGNDKASPFDFHLDTTKIENEIGDFRVTNLSKTINALWKGLDGSRHSRANLHGPHALLGMQLK